MTFTISKTEDCMMEPFETKEINTLQDLLHIIEVQEKETNRCCLLMIGYYNGKPHIVIDN